MTDTHEDRPRGFLTETDREFLTTPRDELDVQRQTIRKRERKIRERFSNALLDLGLIANKMDNGHIQLALREMDPLNIDEAAAFLEALTEHREAVRQVRKVEKRLIEREDINK